MTQVVTEHVRKAGPENQPAGQMLRVTSVTVPGGAYNVSAKTVMTAFTGTSDIIESLFGANGSVGGTCILDMGGVQDSALGTIAIVNRQTPVTLSMQMTRTVAAPTEIILKCAAALPWRTSESSIIATKVGSITQTVEK